MKKLLLALVLSTCATLSHAMLLDFDFSYTDAGTGDVFTGIVRGLTDNATGAASSVEILSNTGGFGIGEYVGNPISNSWRVFNGVMEQANFFSLGNNNGPGAVMDSSFNLTVPNPVLCVTQPCPQIHAAGLVNFPDIGSVTEASIVTFTPADPSVPVPVPATILLLGAGLLGLGWSRRQR